MMRLADWVICALAILTGALPPLMAQDVGDSDLASAQARANLGQWSAEKAWQWYRQEPWLVGCNFLPSTAVNDVTRVTGKSPTQ